MNLGQEEGPQEGPVALNLEVGSHPRVSPNSIPVEPKIPVPASFPSHRP